MNSDAKQNRTNTIKSQCQRGVHASFSTSIAKSWTAQIFIIYGPAQNNRLIGKSWLENYGRLPINREPMVGTKFLQYVSMNRAGISHDL